MLLVINRLCEAWSWMLQPRVLNCSMVMAVSSVSSSNRFVPGSRLVQNLRGVEVGIDIWRSSGPTLLHNQEHLPSQLPRTMYKWLLSVFKKRDSTISLGNLCRCSVPLTVNKCFLMFRRHLLFPFSQVQSLGATEKNLAPSSLHPLFRYRHY